MTLEFSLPSTQSLGRLASRKSWLKTVARLAVFLGASLSFMMPATAQEVVGTSIVEGKKIEILEDFSWRFADGAVLGCERVATGINFCAKAGGWLKEINAPNGLAAQFHRYSGREFANFVIEKVGANQGLTLDYAGDAIIARIANAMNASKSEVPVFFSEDAEFFGKDARTVGLRATWNGVNFVLLNTYWIDTDGAGQAFTYTYGDELRESDRALHREVIRSMVFEQ